MAFENKSNDQQLRKVFVGGLHRDTNNDSMRRYFESWGKILETVVMKDPKTGNSRGFGFVVFEDVEDVDKLLGAKKEHHQVFNIDGRDVEVKRALPKVEGTTIMPTPNKSGKIFVGGVSSSTTEQDLINYFSKYGGISDVELLKDKVTGRLRGFGFVTFYDEDIADKVCQVREHTICGKTCEVKKAQPRGAVKPMRREPPQRYDEPSYGHGNRYDRPAPSGGQQYQDLGQQNSSQAMLLNQLLQQLTGVQGFNQMQDGYGSSGYRDQPAQQVSPNLQQNLLSSLGLGGLNQGGLNSGALGQSGLGAANNVLLASLLGGGNLNAGSLGLGNLNLLSLLANQSAAQPRATQQGWDTNDFSSTSSNTAAAHDYSQPGGSSQFSENSYNYGDSGFSSQYGQTQGNYGPMKYSGGKPGGPGSANKNFRPY